MVDETARAGAFQRISLLLGGTWLGWYTIGLIVERRAAGVGAPVEPSGADEV